MPALEDLLALQLRGPNGRSESDRVREIKERDHVAGPDLWCLSDLQVDLRGRGHLHILVGSWKVS